MVTVLVADDEPHVVHYITTLLRTSEFDLDIHTADSGAAAMECVESMSFHLALLDIDMPGFTGLQVGERISQVSPRTRVLFLTAYDNFDYIYSAMGFRCCGYLLKIEPESVIIERISEILTQIRNESAKMQEMDELKQKSLIFAFLNTQHLFSGICSGWTPEQTLKEMRLMPADMQLSPEIPFYLFHGRFTDSSSFQDSETSVTGRILPLVQRMQTLLQGRFLCYPFHCENNAVMWFLQPTQPSCERSDVSFLKQALDEFVSPVPEEGSFPITGILCCDAAGFTELAQIYQQFRHYEAEGLSGDESCITFVSLKQLKQKTGAACESESRELEKHLACLSHSLHNGDNGIYFSELNAMEAVCRKTADSEDISAAKAYLSIVLMLLPYIERKGQSKLLKANAALRALLTPDLSDISGTFSLLHQVSRDIFEDNWEKKSSKHSHTVLQIQNYIQENYASEITLSRLASVINYNSTYISRLFKAETGQGIAEYITLVRIQHAKELLKNSSLTVQDISDTVGFDTPQYFSTVFKRKEKLSPTDYRLLHYRQRQL